MNRWALEWPQSLSVVLAMNLSMVDSLRSYYIEASLFVASCALNDVA